jgi:RNA polymerase sigma-70 factor, ECF subfamily
MTAQHADELMFTTALPIGTVEEHALAHAFKSGEGEAYRAIHDRYAPRVHSVCRRMLHNPDDAAEAAQETFLRVYQGLPSFNGRYRLGAWVVRIATNVCLDQLRAHSRRPADLTPLEILDLESAPVDECDPAIVFMRHAEGKKVRKILQSLPPMHRAAIVLRDFEGVSYAEIAEVLGISECQVKALLHRARRGFRRQWTGSFASLFAPLVALKRLYRPVKSDAAAHLTPASPAAETAITTSQQATAVASQAFQSCSGLIQGCGQFLTDKAAPVVTAVMVGTATMGAVAINQSRKETPPAPVVHRVAPAATTSDAGAPRAQATSARPAGETAVKVRKEVSATAPRVEPPTPVESAGTQPTPPSSDTSVTVPPPDVSGGIDPEPSPPPSAPVVPEPQDFTFLFSSDTPGEGEPCLCIPDGTQVALAKISVTEQDGLLYLDHLTRSFATAAGTPFYGLELRHIIKAGRGHSMDFVLQRSEGMFRYAGTGARVEKLKTDWGGWLYRYAGTYRLYSRPGGSEAVPLSGTYTTELTVSWRQNRVLSSSVSLTEG